MQFLSVKKPSHDDFFISFDCKEKCFLLENVNTSWAVALGVCYPRLNVYEMATTKAKFNALRILLPHEIDLQISSKKKYKTCVNVFRKICILTKEKKKSVDGLGESHDKYRLIHALMKIVSWFQSYRAITAKTAAAHLNARHLSFS